MAEDSDIEIIEDVTVISSPKKISFDSLLTKCTHDSSSSPPPAVKRSDKISLDEQYDEFGEVVEQKKRKRNRDEVLKAKVEQELVKAEKKRLREEAKLVKENEKKRRKYEREAISAHKSKAEQHTFCHTGKAIFDEIGRLELTAKMLFMERNLDRQLVIDDDLGMRIEWRRKEIDIIEANNIVDKLEYTCQQHLFAVVVLGDTFRNLVESGTLEDFVISQQADYPVHNSQMIVICYGAHNLPSHKIMNISLALFEECRTHVEFLKTPDELALFMAQSVRGLAKAASAGPGKKLLVDIVKGVEDASRDELVRDWWDKMLTAVDRMGNAQRRQLLKKYPDPVAAMKEFERRGYEDVVSELANLVCENGRRLGPQMAHRIFVMITNTCGKAIID